MSKDDSFANYGYQMDELDSYGGVDNNYTIPKAHIDRSSLNQKNSIGPDKIDAPDYNDSEANFTYKIEKRQSSRPTTEDSKIEKEDYSLLSYLNYFKWYREAVKNTCTPKNKSKYRSIFKKIVLTFIAVLYFIYFVAVLRIVSRVETDETLNFWCDSDGFLIIITIFAFTGIFYFHLFKPFIGRPVLKKINLLFDESPFLQKLSKIRNHWIFSCIIVLFALVAFLTFLIIDTANDRSRLVSAFGIVVLILFGFIFSAAPRKVIWRHVLWGLSLQFILGILILRWPVGRSIFSCLGNKVDRFLKFTDAGSEFVFGDQLINKFSVFGFKVLSVILFFSFCIQILYYYGIMQWIVLKIGWLLQVTVGTTACESVNAAANIFLGQTEAPLLIKPYLSDMTKSELHAVMTGGFATIAGSVLAAYISFGISPSHLLSASVMSAPAALGFAKLFYPEVEESKTTSGNIKTVKGTEANVLHAACEGVTTAIPLVANVAANLIAFVAFIALVDTVFNWFCLLADVDDGVCSLSTIFGYVFMPLAWIMGVQWKDCYGVGQLIGTKTFVNEFVAYFKLKKLIDAGTISRRSETIATYALCGFSNISSIGIQVGGLGALAPERKRDLATVAIRAMIAGSVACFLTACVTGTLLTIEELEYDAMAVNSTSL